MREIKFRGFGTIYKKWVYGFYAMQSMGRGFEPSIIQYNGGGTEPTQVIPETVGQFTGILDKNGVEIYEGDILREEHGYDSEYNYYEVCFGVTIDKRYGYHMGNCASYFDSFSKLEVVGNIYDNPKLLKG